MRIKMITPSHFGSTTFLMALMLAAESGKHKATDKVVQVLVASVPQQLLGLSIVINFLTGSQSSTWFLARSTQSATWWPHPLQGLPKNNEVTKCINETNTPCTAFPSWFEHPVSITSPYGILTPSTSCSAWHLNQQRTFLITKKKHQKNVYFWLF